MHKICGSGPSKKRCGTGPVGGRSRCSVIADAEGLGGHGVRQRHKGAVEAPAVVKADVGKHGSKGAVRHGEGEAASLSLAGLRRHDAAVALGDAAAQGQPQAQALGRRGGALRLVVAVEERLQPVRVDAGAGVLHGEKDPPAGQPQLHGDEPPGGGELEGVGQELVKKLLQRVGAEGADMAVRGADQAGLQPQKGGQRGGLGEEVRHELHDVPVPQGQGLLVQVHGGGQVVHQADQAVVALVHQGGLGVQLGVPLPGGGGGQPGGGKIEIAQSSPHLRGGLRQQREVQFHGASPFR